MVCRDAVTLMTDYLEGALRADERRRYEAHLLSCVACTAYLSEMRAAVAVLGQLEPDDLPDAVLDELVELYRRVSAS